MKNKLLLLFLFSMSLNSSAHAHEAYFGRTFPEHYFGLLAGVCMAPPISHYIDSKLHPPIVKPPEPPLESFIPMKITGNNRVTPIGDSFRGILFDDIPESVFVEYVNHLHQDWIDLENQAAYGGPWGMSMPEFDRVADESRAKLAFAVLHLCRLNSRKYNPYLIEVMRDTHRNVGEWDSLNKLLALDAKTSDSVVKTANEILGGITLSTDSSDNRPEELHNIIRFLNNHPNPLSLTLDELAEAYRGQEVMGPVFLWIWLKP